MNETNRIEYKLELENKTITKITAKEREDKRLWSAIALKEAVLNAFVHNDYTTEVPPKFELFEDRIEITSTGGLPDNLSQDEFFEGFSVPRNKEIMRIYKDVDLVEQLGSGVPRILEHYGKECFQFSANFLRMTFPKEVVGSESDITKIDLTNFGQAENSEEIRKKFGTISERLGLSKEGNKQFLQDNFSLILAYLQENFGVSSGKLRDSFGKGFGKGSEKTIPTSFFIFELLTIYSEITAVEIGKIIGISDRSVEKHISRLKKVTLIKRVGGRKEGYWEIIKQEM